MPIQMQKSHWEKPFLWLVGLTAAEFVLSMILYIPFVLALPVWGVLLVLSAGLLMALLASPDSRGARVTWRVLWFVTVAVRWFAVLFALYECLFLGYDAKSCADTCATVAAVVCAVAVIGMPTLAVSVAVGKQHVDGICLLLGSLFHFLAAVFLHGIEPWTIGTVLRVTEAAPLPLSIILNSLALLLAGGIVVAAFFACPARKPKTSKK